MSWYYARKRILRVARALAGRRSYAARYGQLYEGIATARPRTILEIGTHDGQNAVRMVEAARSVGARPRYYGFDLFEDQDEPSRKREASLLARSRDEVSAHLRANGILDAVLVAGDSVRTLAAAAVTLPPMDLVFIDGGHSRRTVESDWSNVQKLIHRGSVVFFDDYPNWGVGPVVDSIDRRRFNVDVLPHRDRFRDAIGNGSERGFREFQLVRVSRRS